MKLIAMGVLKNREGVSDSVLIGDRVRGVPGRGGGSPVYVGSEGGMRIGGFQFNGAANLLPNFAKSMESALIDPVFKMSRRYPFIYDPISVDIEAVLVDRVGCGRSFFKGLIPGSLINTHSAKVNSDGGTPYFTVWCRLMYSNSELDKLPSRIEDTLDQYGDTGIVYIDGKLAIDTLDPTLVATTPNRSARGEFATITRDTVGLREKECSLCEQRGLNIVADYGVVIGGYWLSKIIYECDPSEVVTQLDSNSLFKGMHPIVRTFKEMPVQKPQRLATLTCVESPITIFRQLETIATSFDVQLYSPSMNITEAFSGGKEYRVDLHMVSDDAQNLSRLSRILDANTDEFLCDTKPCSSREPLYLHERASYQSFACELETA